MKYLWLLALLAASLGGGAQDSGPGEFKRSDPALLSATGRPQLVEFFHPG
jgi:hypothetical protein